MSSTELFDFTPEGEAVLKSEQELALPLSARVQRVWATHDFAALTESNAEAGTSKSAQDEEAEAAKKPGELTTDQLKVLKESLLFKLGMAGAELEKTLDLLNATVPFELEAKQPEPNLPLGRPGERLQLSGLGKGPLPRPSLPSSVYDTSLGLATKSAAISKASQTLSSAASGLQTTAQQSAKDWQVYARWKQEGWPVQTRGSGPGAGFQSQRAFEQCAKDIVAMVACEESPAPLRANVAYLKQDQEIDMPKRRNGKRRLVVRFSPAEDAEEQVFYAPDPDDDLMRRGQLELFEEDLFGEISKEAQRHSPTAMAAEERLFRGEISQHKITADMTKSGSIAFEMMPRESLPESSQAPYARTALFLLHLRMTALMQHRRRSAASSAAPSDALTPAPSVLLWVVDLFSSILRVVQLRQLVPHSKQVMPPIGPEALNEIMGRNQPKKPFEKLLRGSLTTDRGIRIFWSGSDLHMETPYGRIALHETEQLQQVLDLEQTA